jgi:RNA polymerase sigma-70 factor (ECF subfamily)
MALGIQMASNDTEALDTIFRSHYERVTRVIGRVIQDQARAEELAVDVFLKWWRTPVAHGAHAEAWIYRAAVNRALDELRSQTRRNRFERLFGMSRMSPATPEQVYAVNVRREQVRGVLGGLNRRYAEVLLLRSQDLSYQEIAAALRLNPANVGSLVSRSQEAFRKEYMKRYGIES